MRKVKQLGLVKKIRVRKWVKRSRAELFTEKEVRFLEGNPDKISQAVSQHLEALPDRGQALQVELDRVFKKSPVSKRSDIDEAKVKEDMLFWYFSHGFSFCEYSSYQFVDKTREERLAYLSDRDSVRLGYEMNDIDDRMILSDKAATYARFKEYYGREVLRIATEADYEAFEGFIGRHRTFMKKNPMESCGRSVERVDLDSVSADPKELFREWIAQGKTVLEELIVQSADVSAFNATSVNTLRCITVRTKNGIETPFFFFKTGRAGSFIDNGAAGGLIVACDRETGVLGMATDECGNRFEAHPDSGVTYVGFQLPDWQQADAMCREMAAKLPTLRIIGWDLAHTDQGWVTIEGNGMTEVIGPQSTMLRGIRKEMETLLADA